MEIRRPTVDELLALRPTTQPTVACLSCGGWLVVQHDGRGHPPDIAKRRLAKQCARNGCTPDITYRAGLIGRNSGSPSCLTCAGTGAVYRGTDREADCDCGASNGSKETP